MPYVPESQRYRIDAMLDAVNIENEGQLAYAIAKLIQSYTDHKFKIGFTELSAIIGVIESLKIQFYNEVLTPYEAKKKEENGDVAWVRSSS